MGEREGRRGETAGGGCLLFELRRRPSIFMTWSGIPWLAEAVPMRNEWHEYDAGGMPDLARTWRKW